MGERRRFKKECNPEEIESAKFACHLADAPGAAPRGGGRGREQVHGWVSKLVNIFIAVSEAVICPKLRHVRPRVPVSNQGLNQQQSLLFP